MVLLFTKPEQFLDFNHPKVKLLPSVAIFFAELCILASFMSQIVVVFQSLRWNVSAKG